MEEADTLCTRIAIIAKGQFRALGTPTHLKAKFGSGYSLSISYSPQKEAEADALVRRAFSSADAADATTAPQMSVVSHVGTTKQFRISGANVRVSSVMRALGGAKDSPIEDWGLSQTSLEEVFMSICRDPSAGAATVTGITDPAVNADDEDSVIMDRSGSVDTSDAPELLSKDWSVMRQLSSLLKKNMLLAFRTYTWLAVFTPVVVCLVVFAIQQAVSSGASGSLVEHPDTLDLPAIRACAASRGMDEGCITIAWAPESYARANDWVESLSSSVKPALSTQSFKSEEDLVAFRLENPRKVLFGIVFDASKANDTSYASYKILFDGNISSSDLVGSKPTASPADPSRLVKESMSATAPILAALDASILAGAKGSPHKIRVGVKSFPLMPRSVDIPTQVAAESGALFFFFPPAILGFIFLYQFVQEKELSLRAGMEMIGLRSSVYWTVWFATAQLYNFITVLVLLASAAAFQFSMFNGSVNFIILFIVFFLFGTSLLSAFFFLSTIVGTRSGANIAGVVVLLVGLIGQLVVGNQFILLALFNEGAAWGWVVTKNFLLILYPPFNFAKVYWDMEAGSTPTYNPLTNKVEGALGYSWANLTQQQTQNSPFGGDGTVDLPTSLTVIWYLVLNCVIFTAVGVYFDQVLYYHHPAWFLFDPSTWKRWAASWPLIGPTIRASIAREKTVHELKTDPRLADIDDARFRALQSAGSEGMNIDPDVAAEIKRSARIFEATQGGQLDDIIVSGDEDTAEDGIATVVDHPAVNIVKLSKVYRSNPFVRSVRDKFAVKNLYLTMGHNQVFCLLGHNGAGKTTTLHVLNGLFPPSGGTAHIFDYDVRTDMAELRKLIGLCPQHDILWPDLTAAEHLRLFAAIKGIRAEDTEAAVWHQLRDVSLAHVADRKASTFSGGMKRRLSVAVASIGQPKLIFMDEGTTGLDPVSKRGVWQLVEALKRRCTVILTTHSLEEADFLSDRIAIMADGEVRCVGSPLHLKNRYGSGYRMHITCEQAPFASDSQDDSARVSSEPHAAAADDETGSEVVRRFISKHCPSLALQSDNAGNLTYGATADRLDDFIHLCELLEDDATCPPAIRAWGVSQTTLEDVFVRVTEETPGHEHEQAQANAPALSRAVVSLDDR